MAAMVLLTMFANPMRVLGQTNTLVSGSGSSGYTIPDGWTVSGTVEGGSYLKFDNGTMTSPEFAPHSGLSFTYSVATLNSGTNHPLTIRILNASTDAVITEMTTATPTSSSYINPGSPLSLGDVNVAFKIQMYGPSGKGVRLRNYSVTGTPAGGQQLTPSDLALTDAPIDLTFDLYNNNSAQTISYTTSGSGTVSVDANSYVIAEVNQQNKTISVTPKAVTGTAQTITVRQAADATYDVGTATFTVNITDSTPAADVTFTAGTDQGTTSANNSPDEMSKGGVTVYGDDAAFATSEYRLYSGSTTTISATGYTIDRIVFSGNNSSYPISRISLSSGQPGTYSNGTWTGSASSISFDANGQARVSTIKIWMTETSTPTVTVTPSTLNTFSYLSTSQYPSAAQSVSVSGTHLTHDITVSVGANSDFEISSTENGTYSNNNITLQETDGTVTATSIWVHMKSGLTGSPTGTLTLSSDGASSVTIPLNGAVVDPMTVAEARTAIDNASGNNVSDAYVAGTISYVEYYSEANHYITYYISDDGSRTNEIEVYRGMGLNGADFNDITDLGVGDQVVVHGDMTLYNSTTYEFSAGSEIISLTPHQAQQYDLTVSALSNVEMLVFNANDLTDELIEGGATAQTAQVLEGTSILVIVSAAQDYGLATFTVDGVDYLADINPSDDSYTFQMPGHNVTITATAQQKYTISFYVNGTVDGTLTREVVDGNPIGTLPSVSAPNGYVHMGWAATTISGVQANAPSMVTSETTVDDDMDLYAVFAIQTGGGSANTYYLVEDNDDLNDGDIVVLYSTGSYKVSGTTYTFSKANGAINGTLFSDVDVDVDNDQFTSTAVAPMTLVQTNNKWKLQIGNQFVAAADKGVSLNDNGSENLISISGGVATITASINSTNYNLQYNPNSGNGRFAYYSSTQKSVSLYKQNTPTYSSYCTSVSTQAAIIGTITEGHLTTDGEIEAGTAVYLTSPITINSGKKLTVYGALGNDNPANLIIEDGGQLICNNAVNATLQKSITGYDDEDDPDGWYTIASPVVGTDMSLSAIGDYDLFKYDETSHTWLNEYNHEDDFTSTSVAEGFLYANGANQTLPFAGEMKASNAEVTKALTYSSTDGKLKGFNLVGNPFTCNLTSSMVKMNGETLSTYYVSEGHANLKVRTLASTPIKPGQGFFVQAPSACDLVFNPSSKDEMDYKPTFISIEAGNSEFTDMAYIQLGYGNTLRKMSINDNTPLVYVMNEGADYAAATVDELKGSMPICFKAASTGQYTISVNTEGLDMSYLHLIDRFTGEDVNLLLEPTYSFIATKGDNESRFILSFTANCFNDSESETFAYQAGNDIFVSGEGELQIFDVTGRMVSTTYVNGIETIKLPSSGMYIFRLVGTEVKTQKIVVR